MLFDMISPIYSMFFDIQVRYYRGVLGKMMTQTDIERCKTVLDLGCGTGALSYVLQEFGKEVVGVDTSSGMLKRAKKKLEGTRIKLIKINPDERLPFEDKSFDLAISSYVIHGLKHEEREKVYGELSRISKGSIIFHDYNQKRSILTDIIEFLEGGDYFNFIEVAEQEMEQYFRGVEVIDVDKKSSWYIIKGQY